MMTFRCGCYLPYSPRDRTIIVLRYWEDLRGFIRWRIVVYTRLYTTIRRLSHPVKGEALMALDGQMRDEDRFWIRRDASGPGS
jgi:hypothetical protein